MDANKRSPKVCIIGAGFSGICAAIQLRKQLGIETFTIYDDNPDVGGTWLVNSYPGAGCDVAVHFYSFSFEPNPYWTKAFADQSEILDYIRHVSRKYEIYPKIKFLHKVTSAKWDDGRAQWRVTIQNVQNQRFETHLFDFVISAVGLVRYPNIPEQFAKFKRPKFHSCQWDHSVDVQDKVVAVVGSGSSASQIIPGIVDEVKRLVVYQRSNSWVLPKWQLTFPHLAKWAFAHIPGVQWAVRNYLFWSYEICYPALQARSFFGKLGTMYCRWNLGRQVKDPELRKELLPNYEFGVKRVVVSNIYYPAMTKPNVTLVTKKIREVTKDSIVAEDGSIEKPDVLVLATGYKVSDLFFAPLEVIGKGGVNILDKWKRDGPCVYDCIACSLAPNFFFVLGGGAYTSLNHSSVIFEIECHVNWIILVLQEMMKQKARSVAVTKKAEISFMREIQEAMRRRAEGSESCDSWFKNENGMVTALWPESMLSCWNRTRSLDPAVLQFSY